jgi:hypothetical protein
MAVSLLSLPDGTSSLEIAPDDLEAVHQAISHMFGKTTDKLRASYSQIAFGGETFLFEQEWDAPCLIALTEGRSLLLAQLEQRLSGSAS